MGDAEDQMVDPLAPRGRGAGSVEGDRSRADGAGIDIPFQTVVQLWHDQTEEIDGIRGRQREGWPRQPGNRAPPRQARKSYFSLLTGYPM
jgi:hypothetical protein